MNDIELALEDLDILVEIARQHMTIGEWLGITRSALIMKKSLEKQIPKKPIRKSWSISKCPACGTNLGEWLEDGYHDDWDNLKICDCGQKLDWSVENE